MGLVNKMNDSLRTGIFATKTRGAWVVRLNELKFTHFRAENSLGKGFQAPAT